MSKITAPSGASPGVVANADPGLSLKAAAAYLGIPENTLRDWRRTNRVIIPSYRLGPKLVRYRKSVLDAFRDGKRWTQADLERARSA
jgi:hypothetical protein